MLAATLREGRAGAAPELSAVRMSSTRPFVPAAAAGTALRNVPLPQDRPYSLGESELRSNYRPRGPGTTFARAAEPDGAWRAPVAPPCRPPPMRRYTANRAAAISRSRCLRLQPRPAGRDLLIGEAPGRGSMHPREGAGVRARFAMLAPARLLQVALLRQK